MKKCILIILAMVLMLACGRKTILTVKDNQFSKQEITMLKTYAQDMKAITEKVGLEFDNSVKIVATISENYLEIVVNTPTITKSVLITKVGSTFTRRTLDFLKPNDKVEEEFASLSEALK